MVGADFSQIELRVAALLSKDRAMIKAYAAGQDLHALTAAAINNTTAESITAEQRQAAKAVNFGNLYGQRGKGLAATALKSYGVHMTEAEADNALLRFAQQFPALESWKQQQISAAKKCGRVLTRLGLVRDFNKQGHGYLAGEATNVPVQGSAAEVLLESITRLPTALASTGAQLVHNVHDELVIQCPQGNEAEAAAALEGAMREGLLAVFPEAESMGLAGPELIDIKQGYNWAEVH